jgi:hypothetical protein
MNMVEMKQDIETVALAADITTYLSSHGYTGIEINSAFIADEQIKPPMMSLYYLPSGPEPFQMGNTTEKLYKRVLQIDLYMESRQKVTALVDLFMDYLDTMAIYLIDPMTGTTVGSLTCQDTDSIYGQVVTPTFDKARIVRWRGILRGTVQAHYPNG